MKSNMPDHARVWIYQANRNLNQEESKFVLDKAEAFVAQWQAHGSQLVAEAHLIYDRFLVFFVDEEVAGVTGCSIDKSVHLVQAIGEEINADFFDRMQILYKADAQIQEARMHDFWAMRKAKVVTDETEVFNNLVKTKAEFDASWETSFGNSWHAEMW